MIPLPQKLRKNTFDYIQVARGEKTCIYAQWDNGKLIAYEVIIIRIKPRRQIKGLWIEAREKFPRNEDIGLYGWVFSCWGKAWEEAWDKAKKEYDKLEAYESTKK